MLDRLICRFINRQVASGKLQEEDRELYEYAYQLLVLQAVNLLILIVIGVGFSCLFPLLLFAAVYIPLRSFAGGWHASTPVRCSLFSAVLELAVAVLLKSESLLATWHLLSLLMIPAGIIIWRMVPSGAASKPLSDSEKIKYRRTARSIWAAELLLFAVLLWGHWSEAALIILIAHVTEAVMLLLNL